MESIPGTQAIARALCVLRAVARTRTARVNLAQLVRDTELNKPTVHRLLLALMADGMVEQDPKSLRYFVGRECYVLGGIASERFGLGREAVDAVSRLARSSGDSAFFSIRSDVFAVCVLREDGDSPLKTHVLQPGTRHPLGVGAGSLAMIAALDDAEAERALKENAALIELAYPEFTPAFLRAEIATTRMNGFAVNEGHVVRGSWGVAAAVHAPSGEVVGALTIAAVESRLPKERQAVLGKQIVDEARRLEAHLRRAAALLPEPKARKSTRAG
ncbi:Transcriptional regulator, IclR family [Candidatus Burkholderia verschuerenii]|uniref:Transcriptional regulator, IclR family n=1 Tax=Candidatus Burkholderia verschuerenii TaxID=242163 RepID=A0A0L0MAX7_9BURK|nr:IclR family transcriptional regulator [Candidatus Burkholderia verschuerenii]KND59069.1 Transcriptional regulator, IclR family [Candidatus Burkholderia verschuerenii]